MVSNGGLQDFVDAAACARPENAPLQEAFFSSEPDDKNAAKNLCFSCDVRQDCIKWALENGVIWGVWGGRDSNDIRRALSVDEDGKEIRRGRAPQCQMCSARTSKLITKVVDLPDGGRWTTARVVECTECGFEWKSRSSANAVAAYHLDRAVKEAKVAKLEVERTQLALERAYLARDESAIREMHAAAAMEVEMQSDDLAEWPSEFQLESVTVWKESKKDTRLARNAVKRLILKLNESEKYAQEAQNRARKNPAPR